MYPGFWRFCTARFVFFLSRFGAYVSSTAVCKKHLDQAPKLGCSPLSGCYLYLLGDPDKGYSKRLDSTFGFVGLSVDLSIPPKLPVSKKRMHRPRRRAVLFITPTVSRLRNASKRSRDLSIDFRRMY